jgi:hypothetical protein
MARGKDPLISVRVRGGSLVRRDGRAFHSRAVLRVRASDAWSLMRRGLVFPATSAADAALDEWLAIQPDEVKSAAWNAEPPRRRARTTVVKDCRDGIREVESLTAAAAPIAPPPPLANV